MPSSSLPRRAFLVIVVWYALRRAYRAYLANIARTLEPTDCPAKLMEESIVADTSCGKVRGYVAMSPRHQPIANFRGVPYAAPPVDALRFKHSVPPQPWAPTVLNATRFGLRSVANPSFGVEICVTPLPRTIMAILFRIVFGFGINANPRDPHPLNPQHGEDCLTLNISVLRDAVANPAKKLPVCVFIHGGGFFLGHSSELLYSTHWGSPLAEQGLVAVSINYRLGVLGYCKVDGGDYNCGLSDQVRALEWIRDEIANFGGDPNQVSIYGQSAGAMSVGALLACPRAKGLFRRAVLQSGAAMNVLSKHQAQRVAAKLARILGVDAVSQDSLKRFSAAALFAAQERLQMLSMLGIMPLQPVVDMDLLCDVPNQLVAKGCCSDVDIMVGTTEREFALFTANLVPVLPFTRWTTVQAVAPLVGPYMARMEKDHAAAKLLAEKLVDEYAQKLWAPSASAAKNWADIFVAILSDHIFDAPASLLCEASVLDPARRAKTWKYLFAFKGPLGSVHGIELPFLHGTYVLADCEPLMRNIVGAPKGDEHHKLSEVVVKAWAAFFKHGDPNCDALPAWKPFSARGRETMVFDLQERALQVASGAYQAEIDNVVQVLREHAGFDTLVRKRSVSGSAMGIISTPSVIGLNNMEQ